MDSIPHTHEGMVELIGVFCQTYPQELRQTDIQHKLPCVLSQFRLRRYLDVLISLGYIQSSVWHKFTLSPKGAYTFLRIPYEH